jgi:hypothetical protein
MKKLIFVAIAFLFLISFVTAENVTNQTTTTTTKGPSAISTAKGVYNFLISINPILLLILGIILILASELSRFVGIVLIIFALIHLLILFFR